MLELAPARAMVVRCLGDARALDAFPPSGAAMGRVAPDELWLLGPPDAGTAIARQASDYLSSVDADGLVVEHSHGWAAWSLSGPDAVRAFARLADFPLPAARVAFVQGLVVQVPAKVLVQGGGLHVIVPVQLAHHIPARVMDACADLRATLGGERDLVIAMGGQ